MSKCIHCFDLQTSKDPPPLPVKVIPICLFVFRSFVCWINQNGDSRETVTWRGVLLLTNRVAFLTYILPSPSRLLSSLLSEPFGRVVSLPRYLQGNTTHSVRRALDCEAKDRGFYSRDRTKTQGLKNLEEGGTVLPCKRLHLHVTRMTS